MKLSRTAGSGRVSGFTLVELLLALTLMSMLLALAYGGLRASTRATDKGQTILEDSSRVRMAHQFVRKQLDQIMPLAFSQEQDLNEQVSSVFEGEPNRIRYVAPMPGYLGFGGPQVQELEIVRGEDGLELVLSHALLQGFEEDRLYERAPIVLLGDIESAEFSFLGRDEMGELMPWVTNWEDTTVLPEAVSLDIEFKEEVFIQWPLLMAAVKTDPVALGDMAADPVRSPSYRNSIKNLMNKRREKE